MRTILVLDEKNYTNDTPVFERFGVRAIIRKNGLIAVQQSAAGEYKLPGGGMDKGETIVEALAREVREETGLILDPDKGLRVLSVRKGDYFRDVWLFRHSFDLSQVTLQPGETVDKCLADKDQIFERFHNGEFVPYDYLEELFSRI